MANGIDTNTPTVRPPTAEEMQGFASDGAPTPPIAPPTYETPEGAFRAEESAAGIQDFASNMMASPSRYDSGLIRDISGVIDEDLAEGRQKATTQLDEMMAQRGLVGSSVEGELYKDMMTDLERERTRRLTDLQRAAADTYAQDVATAGEMGFRSGEFQRGLGQDRANEGRFAADFGQGQYEFERAYGTQSALDARALELQETGMNLDEAYRRARLEQESGQFESEQERIRSEFESELGEVRAARMQDFGFRQEEFDLAVKAQQSQAETEGRPLDIEEARDLAEQDLRLQQLEQEAELAGETIDLDRERLKIQNEQFADNLEQDQQVLEEQRQSRLAQIGIEAGRLQNETLRIQQEAELAGEEMDLQAARDRAEVELRTADRVEEARQANLSLSLEEARIEAEEDMFADELAARQTEFASRLGLETQQYQEQVAARKAEYSDRVSERLSEMGLLTTSQDHDTTMRSLDRTLEREALTLQETGMANEVSWREAERTLMKGLEEGAQRFRKKALTPEKAIAEAARLAEYGARDKDRELKAWATEEDLKQREREYKQASSDKRLEMILAAVEGDIDMDRLRDFISKHQETTKDTGLSGGGTSTTGDPISDVNEFKSENELL